MCSHASLVFDTITKQRLIERHLESSFPQVSYGLASFAQGNVGSLQYLTDGGCGECEEKGRLLSLNSDPLKRTVYFNTENQSIWKITQQCNVIATQIRCMIVTCLWMCSFKKLVIIIGHKVIRSLIRSRTFCVTGFRENGVATMKNEHCFKEQKYS